MQAMTDSLQRTSAKVGLRISDDKTKIQLIGKHNNIQNVTLNDKALDIVENFTYLGSSLSNLGDTELEVRIRIGKAASVFKNLAPVWKCNSISLSVKVRLFSTLVLSILVYACESWKGTEKIYNSIDVFQLNCLRKIMKITWQDRISNLVILKRASTEYLSTILKRRRLQLFGHIVRLPDLSPGKSSAELES